MNLLQIINNLKEYSSDLDNSIGDNSIPRTQKESFLNFWKQGSGSAKIVADQIRLSHGDKAPTYAVPDELLLKCNAAVALYDEYDRLSKIILENCPNQSVANKIGATNPPLLTDEEASNILSRLDLAVTECDREVIAQMLKSKKERKLHVGAFKQITRSQGDQRGSC